MASTLQNLRLRKRNKNFKLAVCGLTIACVILFASFLGVLIGWLTSPDPESTTTTSSLLTTSVTTSSTTTSIETTLSSTKETSTLTTASSTTLFRTTSNTQESTVTSSLSTTAAQSTTPESQAIKSILILNMQNSIKVGSNGLQEEILGFGNTEAYFSCSVTWKNNFYVFGGSNQYARQISKVDDCMLANIGELEFNLTYGACVNQDDVQIFLCFDDQKGNDCHYSPEPEVASSYQLSKSSSYEHRRIRVAQINGTFCSID